MESLKYDNLWLLLSSFKFKEDIPNNLLCSICKTVAIEPFGSLCGCRYCFSCIANYLNDEKKQCPGGKEECIEGILELNVNVNKDLVAIRKLTQLIVKCPHEICEERCKLGSMSDHIRVCDKSTVKCSYESMGCEGGSMTKDNLRNHYDEEWFNHSERMIEAFNNMKNEYNGLKDNLKKKDEQIKKITEDSERKEIMLINMNQQIMDRLNEIVLLNIKDEKREKEIESMKKDLKMKDVIINEIKQHVDIQRREISDLRTREINKTQKTENIENRRKSLNTFKIDEESIEKELNSIKIKVKDLPIFDERKFIWKVDNFSKMKHDRGRAVILWRYSLKLNLYLRCNEDYLTFNCTIMKGEFDDYINWPMKHKITLSLINQDTMDIYKSKEYYYDSFDGDKSAFEKPKNIWNNLMGGNFTTIKDLESSPGLLLNDCLIVSFMINYN